MKGDICFKILFGALIANFWGTMGKDLIEITGLYGRSIKKSLEEMVLNFDPKCKYGRNVK